MAFELKALCEVACGSAAEELGEQCKGCGFALSACVTFRGEVAAAYIGLGDTGIAENYTALGSLGWFGGAGALCELRIRLNTP